MTYSLEQCLAAPNLNLTYDQAKQVMYDLIDYFEEYRHYTFRPLKREFDAIYTKMFSKSAYIDAELVTLESNLENPNDPAFRKFKEHYQSVIQSFCESHNCERVQSLETVPYYTLVLKEYAQFSYSYTHTAGTVLEHVMESVFHLDRSSVHDLIVFSIFEHGNEFNRLGRLRQEFAYDMNSIFEKLNQWVLAYKYLLQAEAVLRKEIVRVKQFVDVSLIFARNSKPTLERYYEFKNKLAESSDETKQTNNSFISKDQLLQYELCEAFQNMYSENMILDLELETVKDELDDVPESPFAHFKARHEQFVNDFCSEHNCVVKPHPYTPVGYCLILKEYEKLAPNVNEQEIVDFMLKSMLSSASQQDQDKTIEKEIIRIREFIDSVLANFYKLSPSVEDVQALLSEQTLLHE